MHVHSFFAESSYHLRPLAPALAAGGATLVAWSLVGDLLWFDPRTFKQKSSPGRGEAFGWLRRELDRIKTHIAEQGLKTVRTASESNRLVETAAAQRREVVIGIIKKSKEGIHCEGAKSAKKERKERNQCFVSERLTEAWRLY